MVRKQKKPVEEQYYEVEKIVKTRKKGNTTEYFIKWEGYQDSANTWEPESNLNKELLADYKASQKKEPSEKPKKVKYYEKAETHYEIEKIVKARKKGNTTEYFIKWEGYQESDNTWEPESNLDEDMLAEYKASQKKEPSQKPSTKPKIVEKKSGTASTKPKRLTRGAIATAESSSKRKRDYDENATAERSSKRKRGNDDDENAQANTDLEKIMQLEEPHAGKSYKIEEGVQLKVIHGIKKYGLGVVMLVSYTDDSMELVPSMVVNRIAPEMVREYYEARIDFSS